MTVPIGRIVAQYRNNVRPTDIVLLCIKQVRTALSVNKSSGEAHAHNILLVLDEEAKYGKRFDSTKLGSGSIEQYPNGGQC
ncbi:hypothetical protein GJ744_008676 [Endocarpon pusillum]|uniref:Uncharacterized protein n=1 Tax=Endocarpon pusillum TaxID=364733 RepID=A0A8H7AIK0_9EURO|nr:hypothetical protein GJ744_008676 [Endocarpon pusillum]